MRIFHCVVVAMAVAWSSLLAAEAAPTPYQLIKSTTDRVTTTIEESKAYYDQDPQRYYAQIDTIMSEIVDFDSFARGVMGNYASKREYNRLATAEEKAAYRARMTRFSKVFRGALVETYAKGLLAFSGNKIEVLDPEEADPDSGSVTVVQHIYDGNAEKPFVVLYKMRKDKAGQWKLRNVTIEAVNLGKVYQSQFASAVKQHGGDVDKVIDGWVVVPVQPQPQAEAT
jgi:phospholipid transport system substrate-binding protein